MIQTQSSTSAFRTEGTDNIERLTNKMIQKQRSSDTILTSDSDSDSDAESQPANKLRDDTLVKLLQEERVPLSKVIEDYPDFTAIATLLIGIVPVCDTYLSIWPKAMKSYNLIVPNLMNVPFAQMRVGPGYGRGAALQGLGMYMVSKSAECPYCTAHTCSYAIRRGASIPTLLEGMNRDPDAKLQADEQATIAVAQSLGRVPCTLTSDERNALITEVGDRVTENIIFGILSMGYLNKVMDAVGVELENSTYLETRDIIGTDYADSKAGMMLDSNTASTKPPSKDSLSTLMNVIPRIPGALMLDAQYIKGVPNTWPQVGEHLQNVIGYSFPGLSSVSRSFLGKRSVVAIATCLIDNFDANDTYCTIPVKIMAGLIFAQVAQSDNLKTDFKALATAFNLNKNQIRLARQIANRPSTEKFPNSAIVTNPKTKAYLRLARAISTSPAQVSVDIVNELECAKVEPKGIMELVNFIAVAQLLLRLDAFYPRSHTNFPNDLSRKERKGNRRYVRESEIEPVIEATSAEFRKVKREFVWG